MDDVCCVDRNLIILNFFTTSWFQDSKNPGFLEITNRLFVSECTDSSECTYYPINIPAAENHDHCVLSAIGRD